MRTAMTNRHIITENDTTIRAPSSTKLKAPRALVFVRNGKKIGKVSATFDFNKLPQEWHELALQVIQEFCMTKVHVGL